MKKIALTLAIVFAATSAAAKNLYIPAAGTAPGANGTHFRTDVRIFNPSSTTPISISVHFLPRAWTAPTSPAASSPWGRGRWRC